MIEEKKLEVEAHFYVKLSDEIIQCQLCPHHCIILEGKRGRCLARINDRGRLIAQTYGKITGMTTETFTEIPVLHYPKEALKALSIGSYGCNMHCLYCRNHRFSQKRFPTETVSPEEIVQRALNLRNEGICAICYTYNEPVIWYEFIRDTSKLAREAGLLNILDTNGYLDAEPWKKLIENIDIINFDVKGFNESFYENICQVYDVHVIEENLRYAWEYGIHTEVTTLIVGPENAAESIFSQGIQRLAEISPELPLNLATMNQHYLCTDRESITAADMATLVKIASQFLQHVKVVESP